jgi:hypothetical protein
LIHRNLSRALSGIEAGVIGGMAMLALLATTSLWRNRGWWEIPNLLGSTFYGVRAFRPGPNLATLAGASLQLMICGCVGALFGVLFGRVRSRRRMLLFGAFAGILWSYLADAFLWRQVNPLVTMYSGQPAAVLGHALFGVCLGYMGRPQIPEGNILGDAVE